MPAAHGVTTGVFFGAGSRYEREKIAGASHFLEHMFFKGTKNRPEPSDIARSIEGVGGYLNAATSQDHTFYYNRVPKAHGKMAFEVLADMMNNSLFKFFRNHLKNRYVVWGVRYKDLSHIMQFNLSCYLFKFSLKI